MTLSGRFAAQLAPRSGLSESLLGRAMDLANARPMRLAIAALEPKADERILDASCGTGAALALVRAAVDCRLYGIDPSEEMLAVARQRLGPHATLARGAIDELAGLDWQPFDAILAFDVLYFADSGGAMIAALREALRPEGRLVAYVTRRNAPLRWRSTDKGRHQSFDAGDLEHALVQGGFASASILIAEHDIAPGLKGLIARAAR